MATVGATDRLRRRWAGTGSLTHQTLRCFKAVSAGKAVHSRWERTEGQGISMVMLYWQILWRPVEASRGARHIIVEALRRVRMRPGGDERGSAVSFRPACIHFRLDHEGVAVLCTTWAGFASGLRQNMR